MKTTLLIFTIFLSLNLFADEPCMHDKDNFNCVEYVKNYDADTVTFNIPYIHPLFGSKINVRVLGVDTPELRTKDKCEKEKGHIAKDLVTALFKNAKRIDLKNIKRGKYFRIVADIVIDGQSLTTYLLKNGLAYSYDGGTKKVMDWCRASRDIASENP
jgi:micrococcal nuclease